MQKLTFLAVVLGLSLNLAAEEKKPAAQPDAAAAMKAWLEFATPSAPHLELVKTAGEYTTEFTSYGPEASKSAGKATIEAIMDGRFVRQKYEGEMFGQKFTGEGIWGYDNGTKKYVGMWIDSMGTSMMHTTGAKDPKTGIVHETCDMSSPHGVSKCHMTTEHSGDEKFTFSMYMVEPDGKETKHFQIVYTRVKTK